MFTCDGCLGPVWLGPSSAVVNLMKKPLYCLLRTPSCEVLTQFIAHKTRFGVNDKQLDLLTRKFGPNVCFMGSVGHQLYIVK